MLQMMFSTNGLLQNIHRNILYVTVQQETVRQVQVMTFNHLLHLKYEWHVKRKTGEVLRSNDRGANSGLVRIRGFRHDLTTVENNAYIGYSDCRNQSK